MSLSDAQLALIRSKPKWSQGYIVIPQFNVIYSAVLNGVPTLNDQVTQLGYTEVSGTLANVKVDMTVRVGSTPNGYDLGLARIRKAPDGSYIYIGAVSDIRWDAASPVYLTIMDEFGLWQRAIGMDTNGNPIMDWDEYYDDQHTNFDPVPILGGHVVAMLTGASVSVKLGPPSGMSSYVPGSSVSGVSWEIPGALSIDNAALVNPTVGFNTAGTYPCYCTINGANGKSFWGVIYVIILDADHPPLKAMLTSRTADYSSGGWNFSVSLSGNAGITSIPPHAMVIQISKDYFNGAQQTAPSPIEGSNIVCVGWIADEKVDFNGAYGQADFTVQGAAYFLQNIYMSGINLAYSASASAWTQMTGLTVDLYLYHCLRWRSTATRIMDVMLTGNTNLAQKLESGDDTLWKQMTTILDNNLFGIIGVDWYGRLWAQIEPQMVPVANRTWDVVQTLEKKDWQNNDTSTPGEVWEWDTMNAISIYAMTGLNFTGGGTPTTLYGLAPGAIPKRWGTANKTVSEQPLVASQDELNMLCGLYVGWKNNDHPNFDITLPGSYRAFDLFPVKFLPITIDPADDVRGKGYSGHIIPRKLTFTTDANGYEYPQLNAEGETFPEIGVNGPIPPSPTPPTPPKPTPPPSPPGPTPGGGPGTVVQWIVGKGAFYTHVNASNPSKSQWKPKNDGINPTDIGNVIFFEWNPKSDECWLLVDGYGTTGNYIYYSPYLGATWKVILTLSQLNVLLNYMPNTRVFALGINPGAAGEAMIIGGQGNGGGSWGAYWLKGSSSGFILKSACPNTSGNGFIFGNIVYGSNKWAAMIGNGFGSSIQHCNRDGSGGSQGTPWVTYQSAGDCINIVHAGKDGGIFYAKRCHVSNASVNIIKTTDLGETISDIDAASFFASVDGSALGVSPDGTCLMATDPSGIAAQRSVDSAATWGVIPGGLGGGDAFWCYGSNNLWIMVTGCRVYYSTDGGDTWNEMTGDLQSWVGSIGWRTQILRGQ